MWCFLFCFVFFFKQKTAYEMRISDWSSDVCSSDLPARDEEAGEPAFGIGEGQESIAHRRRAEPFMPGQAVPAILAGRPRARRVGANEIGSESCRERVCQYV